MNNNTELYEKLRKLQWLLQKQHMKNHSAVGPIADPSRGQGRILAFLQIKDGISTKDLSYLLGIRVSSLNELLVKLEKNDYITRIPSEEDKRIMLIHLTQKGKDEKEQEREENNIFSCLSQEEQLTFGGYTDRIIAALENELGTENEQDELYSWMEAARQRMGSEQFEELMAMHPKMHGMRNGFGDSPFRGGFHGHGHGHERHGERHPFNEHFEENRKHCHRNHHHHQDNH